MNGTEKSIEEILRLSHNTYGELFPNAFLISVSEDVRFTNTGPVLPRTCLDQKSSLMKICLEAFLTDTCACPVYS